MAEKKKRGRKPINPEERVPIADKLKAVESINLLTEDKPLVIEDDSYLKERLSENAIIVNYSPLFNFMKACGITKTELTKACNMSSLTMSQMSHGFPINIATLSRICEVLHLQPSDVFYVESEKCPSAVQRKMDIETYDYLNGLVSSLDELNDKVAFLDKHYGIKSSKKFTNAQLTGQIDDLKGEVEKMLEDYKAYIKENRGFSIETMKSLQKFTDAQALDIVDELKDEIGQVLGDYKAFIEEK